MDENGAQESHVDFYAQLDSLKAQKKKYLKTGIIGHRILQAKPA